MSEKILIIDDDLETVRLVGLMLQRQGYQIVAANNGAQGLANAARALPDLILLDVMMPDTDGYMVTRKLRQNPLTTQIPILMFTARSQVEDRVAGFEAGVDDYLTKPIHPAELLARVKALLARGKGRTPQAPVAEPAAPRGYMVGVMAPRGGMGVSTLVLNLAISLAQRAKIDPLAIELRPGNGTWAMDLGFAGADGLNKILSAAPEAVTPKMVETECIRTTYGPRLLMASYDLNDVEFSSRTAQMEALLKRAVTLSPLTLVDLGVPTLTNLDTLLELFPEILVVTEPFPGIVDRTRRLIEELNDRGFGKSRYLSVVIQNRVRADIQLSIAQVQEKLGTPVTLLIPPAPEMAYQAAMRSVPLINVQPESLLAKQYAQLADTFSEKITSQR